TVLALHLPVSPGGELASAAPSKRSSKVVHTASAKTGLAKSGLAKSGSARSAEASDEDSPEQASVLHHKVKSGETLYSIATTYKTTVAALKRNNQNVATLRPGMILVVEPAR
ncbi:MAG: LysM peptidoglycan-binding domain-containing protein, partial [Candidatus Sulfotelmatobacter sp.]